MCNAKIKVIQFDGASEYTSHCFHNFLSSHGITHRIYYLYTSEQNRVAGETLTSK